ncbi:MAG: hypothetical protein KBS52_04740 [Clostridiales bacterium]|nr:hypothetical protein [Candidatus Equinaster intestinalis]
MSDNEKKEYLELYLVQSPKIERLSEQMRSNPMASRRYIKQIRNARKLKKEIEQNIDRVDGGLLSEVLGQKYLCGKSLEEIALTLNYSKRHIERLHASAIERFTLN